MSFKARWIGLLLALQPVAALAQPVARFDWFEYRGEDPVGPAGAGAYRNPILQGFYPDPSVTRVGQHFYLVTSTFSYFPGIPVFHSRDLVGWTQIGNAIDRPGMLDFGKLGLSRGVFAPSIQAKDGIFYILNTCVDCGDNFMLTARNPAGPWSDPVWLPDLKGGIDPSLFFDTDGRSWIVNNGPPEGRPQYEGHRAIWIQEFDLQALKTVGPRKMLVNGGVDFSKKPIWIEGPHIFRKDGWYYLSCAEGGTAQEHSQVILRSKSVTGPYVPFEGNPILTQRDLPRDRADPVNAAGHAQLVTLPDGSWWATFLGVRDDGQFHFNTGRETFLLPVTWKQGWPFITTGAIPYAHVRPPLPPRSAPPVPTSGSFTIRDAFDGTTLPPYWMMMRNPRERWYTLDKGTLTLTARPVGLGDNANPSFLARRQQHAVATATTVVDFTPVKDGDRAGLVALQSDDYWMFIGVGMRGGQRVVTVETHAGHDQPVEGITVRTIPLGKEADGPIYLQIAARDGRYSLAYGVTPNHFVVIGTVDGRTLSTRTAGGFVGAVFGVFAATGE